MATQYAQNVNNGNKCPHGLPLGACPICSGMGGGSKTNDRNTRRKPGEMTYNECMAQWLKIQARNEAKMQAKLDRLEALTLAKLELKIMQEISKTNALMDKLLNQLDSTPLLKIPVKIIVNVIIKPILNLISKIPSAIKNIQTFLENINQFINSVSEKLASIFGEIKNFINSKVILKAKEALKTILSLFTENEEDEDENKQKLKDLTKVIKGIFRKKHKEEEKEEDEN